MRIWGKFLPPVGIEEARSQRLEAGYGLQIHPNPFRRQTQVKLAVAQGATDVGLSIYDVSGRIVKRFNHLTVQPFNQVIWDGSDETGRELPAGVYFCRLEGSDYSFTEKIVKLK
jgi:flagellar hook assembly protein FlgD